MKIKLITVLAVAFSFFNASGNAFADSVCERIAAYGSACSFSGQLPDMGEIPDYAIQTPSGHPAGDLPYFVLKIMFNGPPKTKNNLMMQEISRLAPGVPIYSECLEIGGWGCVMWTFLNGKTDTAMPNQGYDCDGHVVQPYRYTDASGDDSNSGTYATGGGGGGGYPQQPGNDVPYGG